MFIFKACRAKGGRHSPTYPAPLGGVPKRVYMTMENFAQLLEESFTLQEMNPGEVITAEVVGIDQNFVTVNAGLKSESLIDVAEFKNAQGEIEVKVGDFVTVTIESVENGFGETKLSREKAKRAADWIALEEAMERRHLVRRYQWQSQRRPDRHDQQHPCILAGFFG